MGDAAEVARLMYADGVDEIVFYDITASPERRRADLETVRAVAHNVFVPLTVGGGMRDLEDMHAVLAAGRREDQHRLDGGAQPQPHHRGVQGVRAPVHRAEHAGEAGGRLG